MAQSIDSFLDNIKAIKPAPKAQESNSANNSGNKALEREKQKLKNREQNIAEVSNAMLNVSEIAAAGMVSSFIEGYVGSNKLNWGGFDVRLLAAGGLLGKGIYDMLTGSHHGQHMLYAGAGVGLPLLFDATKKAGHDFARPKIINVPNEQAPKPVASSYSPNESSTAGVGAIDTPHARAYPHDMIAFPPAQDEQLAWPQPPRNQVSGAPLLRQPLQHAPYEAPRPPSIKVTPPVSNVSGLNLQVTPAEEPAPHTREITLARKREPAQQVNGSPAPKQHNWLKLNALLPDSE